MTAGAPPPRDPTFRDRPPLWVLLLAVFVVGFMAGEARALFLSWAAAGWAR